jgi:hypothetical protein
MKNKERYAQSRRISGSMIRKEYGRNIYGAWQVRIWITVIWILYHRTRSDKLVPLNLK